tara:strand:+ start:189 stop:341 length:153 start_codon:yes stop_codon:yes gene_type:complete
MLRKDIAHAIKEAEMMYPDTSSPQIIETASKLSGIPTFMIEWELRASCEG